jgi:acyl-CoA thioester hydrolase
MMPVKPHSLSVKIYYADTDCGGVVYYANYLKYMEQGRTELMRDLGIDLALLHERGILFAVTDIHLKYRAPARYNDTVTVESRLVDTSSILLTFENTLTNQAGTLLVKGETRLACISREGKAVRIPEDVAAKLKAAVPVSRT